MSTYLVSSGRDFDGNIMTYTVQADTFTTDDHFTLFKVGNVIVKAVQTWSIESIELLESPESKSSD